MSMGRWPAGPGHPVPNGPACGAAQGQDWRTGTRRPRPPARLLRAGPAREYDGQFARQLGLVDDPDGRFLISSVEPGPSTVRVTGKSLMQRLGGTD